MTLSPTIFHIARLSDWESASARGEYRVSTLGRTLEEEGFIHCSASAAQVLTVANDFYRDVSEPLVLLTIDPSRVRAAVRDEVPAGAVEAFPHIYGPLPTGAVTHVVEMRRVDGSFVWPESQPTSRAFDAAGLRLVVHEWGGDGAPVLLAHPTGFHGRIWVSVARRLVAAGRRVYSFDFRGHGDSDAPAIEDESYSWHGFADDVLAVAQHLDLAGREDLVAAGHSKGGAALLLAEARVPGTFARIWAYEPIMFAAEAPLPAQEEFGMARAARRRRNAFPSLAAAFESYASKPPLDVMTEESLRAYVEYGLHDRGDGVFALKCRPEVEARIYTMGPNHGAYGLLGDIAAPVLVVCGETSRDISPAFGARIAERLPDGALEVMPRCGHFGPQQDPDATAASMLDFATRA